MDIEAMQAFVRAARKVARAEEDLKAAKVARDAMKQALIEAMIEDGVLNTTVSVDGAANTIYIDSRTYVGRTEGTDAPTLIAAFEACGMGEMISHSVSSARLTSWANELSERAAEEGRPRIELVAEELRPLLKFSITNDLRMRASSSSRRAAEPEPESDGE